MLVALILISALADWVPARWNSSDPKTLELVAGTPVNCLLLEQPHWSKDFAEQASARNVATLGVIRPDNDPVEAAQRALAAKLTGVVLEGDFDPAVAGRLRDSLAAAKAPVVELRPRGGLDLREPAPIAGTYQGVWPGIQVQKDGAAKSGPTGAPWIDTNTGFLRFVHAATDAAVWIGYEPPPGAVIPVQRYLQAICDAALMGARWIVTLDDDFSRRLLAREEVALRNWRRMAVHLKYFEDHKEWKSYAPHGQLAMIQDADSGALLSGSILDMIGVKHTPVRPVPRWKLAGEALKGSRMAVNVDPQSLSAEQKEVLRDFARGGGTLLSGPPGWRFPATRKDQVTLGKDDLETLDDIWKGVNSLVGRTNLGVRLFNVASMLSNLLASPDESRLALHLVNYSGYPVEAITAHFLGSYKRARLLSPEAPPRDLEVYPVEEGTGVDIPQVVVCATLVVEK